MPASPPDIFPNRRPLWVLLLPAAVALAYAAGHLAWYRTTPLGQVPVLDEQENLALAEAIVRHALPREPFYRAPGYALGLATLRVIGVTTENLFTAALAVGAALHAINASLCAHIASTWFGLRAALAAGLLCALNPVFVHYATQALDAIPALTLFLLGLACIASAVTRPREMSGARWPWVAASVCWAGATLLRPNYLPAWCALPLLALGLAPAWRRRAAVAALAGAGVFLALAAWQWRASGVAGFLPWQGAYNLWAANQPGSHGRYYVQRVSLPAAVARHNPARAESVYLYQQETGAAPRDIPTLNAHWRARFLQHITQEPVAWLGQLARKAYALLNNWEQYNNKTFAFHQARSPWLRWNPLGWGVLAVLAVAGTGRLHRAHPGAGWRLGALAALTAASIVLFFVSARFRLPLAALATVLAGGALAAPRFWQAWPRPPQIALGVALAGTAAIAFSRFDGVRDRATFVQDHALLARAAATVGDDDLAWTHATAALQLQPAHPDALRLAVAAYFNQLCQRRADPAQERAWQERCAQFLAQPPDEARALRAVAALGRWRAGQTAAARAEWESLGAMPPALAARLLIGDLAPAQVVSTNWPRAAWGEPLVRLAALRGLVGAPPGVARGDGPDGVKLADELFHPQLDRAP